MSAVALITLFYLQRLLVLVSLATYVLASPIQKGNKPKPTVPTANLPAINFAPGCNTGVEYVTSANTVSTVQQSNLQTTRHRVARRDAPYASYSPVTHYEAPATVPVSEYGPPQIVETPTVYEAPPAPVEEYGPPAEPVQEYGPPPIVETPIVLAPPPPPPVPELPEIKVAPYSPATVYEAPEPPAPSVEYGPPAEPIQEYGPPPVVEIPTVYEAPPAAPVEEYGPPAEPVQEYGPPPIVETPIVLTPPSPPPIPDLPEIKAAIYPPATVLKTNPYPAPTSEYGPPAHLNLI